MTDTDRTVPEGAAAEWGSARTISGWLALRRAATPEAEAFRHETSPAAWTGLGWDAFAERVGAVQHGLHKAGLRRGDRLALILPASLEWELLHHAALGLGIVVVGLDAHDLPERLADMARQAGVAAFAIADTRLWQGLQAAVPQAVLISTGAGPSDTHRGDHNLQAWLADNGASRRPPVTTGLPESTALPDDLATIIFTSGTTGAPKGIGYSHAQLCLAVDAIADAFDFAGNGSRLLCWLPLSNLFQRVVNLAALRRGAVTWLLADPRRVMEVVATASPDVFVGVPRFYEKLLDGIRANVSRQSSGRQRLVQWAWQTGRRTSGLRLAGRPVPWQLKMQHRVAERLVLSRIRAVMGSRLQCMVTGSAPMPPALLHEYHALGWTVLEAYGLSENVLPMALNRLGDFRFGSVGRPLPGNDIVVGSEGQLRVRGAGVFTGYLGRPAGEALDAHGFYATGDIGRIDADGFLHLTGRSNDIIKTSTGRRVAPAGVEAQLRAVPGVDQAVLIGAGRKALVALCSLSAPAPAASALRLQLEAGLRSCVAAISEHERPVAVGLLHAPFGIDAGELTPNLKLRRGAIEARHAGLIDKAYREADAGAVARRSALPVVDA